MTELVRSVSLKTGGVLAHQLHPMLRHPGVLPLALFSLALVLRLLGLDRRSVWFDEAVTHGSARLPFLDLLIAARSDVHPPLSYLLYGAWPWLDANDFWLRFPSAILGALAIPVIWCWARRVGSPGVAHLTALLVAVAPFQVDLAQEARMYGLMLALCAGTLLLFERVMDRPSFGRAATYALVATALLYTHYYGALWLAAQAVGALVMATRRVRPGAVAGLLALGVSGCLFLPWLPGLLAQLSNVREGFWIEPPRPATLWITYRALVAHTPPDAQLGGPLRVAYVLIALLVLKGGLQALRSSRTWYSVLQLVVPPVLAIIISLAAAPVFAVRYLSPIGIPFALLVAVGIRGLPSRGLQLAAIAVALFPPLVSLPPLYTDPGYSRPDLRAAVQYLESNRQPGEVLLHLGPFTDLPAAYYGARSPSRVLQTNDSAELCASMRGTSGGWLLTAYAVTDDAAADMAEAGITRSDYAGGLVEGPPARFPGTSLFRLRPCAL